MRKLFKILTILIGVVLALVAVAVIVLMVMVDPNRYRDDIVAAVKTHTGRDLKIEGKLKLSLFPWLGLETGRLTLSNAPGFGREPMARVESGGIQVALLPLLRKQVQVDGVRLNGLTLHLARAADGHTNWDDLTKASKAPAAKPKPAPADKNAGSGVEALSMFSVRRLEVHKSEFTWRDQTTGANYAFKNVELTSGNLLGAKPAPLQLAFDFESGQPKVARRVTLDAAAAFDPAKETLDLPKLKLVLGDLKLNAQLRGTDVLKAPKLTGKLEVPAFDLRALLRELNVPYVPTYEKALTKVGLTAQLQSSAQSLSITGLKLTLDGTQLTGGFGLQYKPRTSYRADLAVDDIDIDRYLPKAEDKSGDKKTPASTSKAAPAVIPIALLRDTEADAQLKVQKLKAFGIRSQQAVIKLSAHGGRISIGPSTAQLYDGSYAGRTQIDATGKTPKFQFEEKLTGVQLGPFLKDAGVFDRFSGGTTATLALTAQGLDADGIKKTLNGSVAVAVQNGVIDGVDLLKIQAKVKEIRDRPGSLAEKAAALPEVKPEKGDHTKFSKLQATASVTNGIVSNRDLAIEAPPLTITGAGTVNLPADKFERYVLRIGDLPVVIDGPLAAPKFGIDWNEMLKKEAKQEVQQQKKKIEKKLIDKLLKKKR